MTTDIRQRRISLVLAAISLTVGVGECVAYGIGYRLPVIVGIVVFAACGLATIFGLFTRIIGPICGLVSFVFSLPFIHLLHYVGFTSWDGYAEFFWGLKSNPYMFQKDAVELMGMMGSTGICALTAALFLSKGRYDVASIFALKVQKRSMPLWAVLVLLLVSCTISWLVAPAQTMLETTYTNSNSIVEGINFGSGWLVAIAVNMFCLFDAIQDRSVRRSIIKAIIVGLFVTFSLWWFQFLRGDREGIVMVLVFCAAAGVWGATRLARNRIVGAAIGIVAISFGLLNVVIANRVGELRSCVAGVSVERFVSLVTVDIAAQPNTALCPKVVVASGVAPPPGSLVTGAFDALPAGTWTAVLLTPLSVAGDDSHGLLDVRWGRTYIDLALSAVPGFVAHLVGYERPIDGTRGPAWEMRFGIGGTHAVVVPFMNFRMVGILFIVGAWAWALAVSEKKMLARAGVRELTFLGLVGIIAPHWLWYGEKNLMTALLIWAAFSLAYYFLVERRRDTTAAVARAA